jgi:endonuclease YncB( thermonuclease family)
MPVLSKSAYSNLLGQIRRTLSAVRSHRTVDQQLLLSYWSIGQRLVEAGVVEDAAYGDSVIETLATDAEVDRRTLQRSLVFFREYEQPPTSGLSWAHYRELLTISDEVERRFYEALALQEKLSRDKLVRAIQSDVFSTKGKPKRRVVLKRPAEPRYLFEAALVRGVDGDTLLLRIDLGFGLTKEHRVRLAAVDTFSASSLKGRAATAFVVERLTIADRIVVQTRRADLHGRYLAHVFYSTRSLGFLETFVSGHYLNQDLLDQKLATKA